MKRALILAAAVAAFAAPALAGPVNLLPDPVDDDGRGIPVDMHPVYNMPALELVLTNPHAGGKFGKGELVAELDINPDLWFFACHFEGDPVMPGCLGLDAMWQLVGFYLGWQGNPGRGRALGSGEVKFFGQVLPTAKKVTYNIHIKRVLKGKLNLAIADGSVSVDGREIYTAEGLRVGVFTSTENF